jgi:hypothetical protein
MTTKTAKARSMIRAERDAELARQRAAELAAWRAEWPQRFIRIAYMATRAYIDESLDDNPFTYFSALRDGSIQITMRASWGNDEMLLTQDSPEHMIRELETHLEDAIEKHREEIARRAARKAALSKLTPEERMLLNLPNY